MRMNWEKMRMRIIKKEKDENEMSKKWELIKKEQNENEMSKKWEWE